MTISAPADPARRTLLLASGAFLVGGCSQTPGLSLLKDGFSAAFPDSSTYPRTRPQVEALPYAQLGVRIGGGSHGIMVLAEKSDRDLHWISANRMLLVTRGGRIVRTVGLPTDLLAARNQGADLLDLYDPEKPMINGLETAMSVDTDSTYGVVVKSRYQIEGSETIRILEEDHETLRVREEISSDLWRWRATNIHWLSKRSPLIWRSLQHLMPNAAAIELEMLKRPS